MPPIIILAFIMCGTVVVITAMSLFARHLAQRRPVSDARRDDEIASRLERIEQTVEATAVEVERLAESNRFVARLLAERSEAR